MCDPAAIAAVIPTSPPTTSPSTSPSSTSSSTTPSASMDPIDTTYYTWSTFFRALSGQATDTEMRAYIHTRSLLHESSDIARAEKHRDWLLAFSPTIRFLRDSISKLGGDLDSTNIRCIRCDTMSARGIRQGAFAGDMGIVLCANHLRDRKTTEDVLAHEMVHAYDYMRFKYDKWNLKHMACTEIRANALSGECRWTREFFNQRQYRFTAHFQDCVRRRAALAVGMHSSCKDEAQAQRVVNDVWDSCFPDTRPFDEIYR